MITNLKTSIDLGQIPILLTLHELPQAKGQSSASLYHTSLIKTTSWKRIIRNNRTTSYHLQYYPRIIMSSNEHTYLVLCATGRQGSAVVDALITKNVSSIVASSRNPSSLSQKRGKIGNTQHCHLTRHCAVVSSPVHVYSCSCFIFEYSIIVWCIGAFVSS